MRKLSIDYIQPGMIVGKPILGSSGQILLNDGIIIKSQHIFYLKYLGIDDVYIRDERMKDVHIEDTVSDQVRSEGRLLISQIVEDINTPGPNNKGINIHEKDIIELVTSIIVELIENADIMIQLIDLRTQDEYLFAHAVNCSVLTTLVAVKLDYHGDILEEIAIGSLLHDIGMVAVPRDLIMKKGKLTKSEFEIVKQHPQYGYEIFRKSSLYSPDAGKIILQHHERNEGQGYPRGLKAEKIELFSHIMAVVDVFDALTSNKPNRDAYRTHQAVEILMSLGGEYFNLNVLRFFLSNIAAYPAGTHVLLSNGESGLVIANRQGYALRPVVRILYRGEDLSPHPSPYDLDLKKSLNLTVEKVLEEPEAYKN